MTGSAATLAAATPAVMAAALLFAAMSANIGERLGVSPVWSPGRRTCRLDRHRPARDPIPDKLGG